MFTSFKRTTSSATTSIANEFSKFNKLPSEPIPQTSQGPRLNSTVGACYVRGTASWSGLLAARLRYEVEQTNKQLGQVRLCRVEVGGFISSSS